MLLMTIAVILPAFQSIRQKVCISRKWKICWVVCCTLISISSQCATMVKTLVLSRMIWIIRIVVLEKVISLVITTISLWTNKVLGCVIKAKVVHSTTLLRVRSVLHKCFVKVWCVTVVLHWNLWVAVVLLNSWKVVSKQVWLISLMVTIHLRWMLVMKIALRWHITHLLLHVSRMILLVTWRLNKFMVVIWLIILILLLWWDVLQDIIPVSRIR